LLLFFTALAIIALGSCVSIVLTSFKDSDIIIRNGFT
jgi:hypothetical protein